ncbi:35482_t:CDS:1, partial [Racocetra persica]
NDLPVILANPECETEYCNYGESEVDLNMDEYDSSNSDVEVTNDKAIEFKEILVK